MERSAGRAVVVLHCHCSPPHEGASASFATVPVALAELFSHLNVDV